MYAIEVTTHFSAAHQLRLPDGSLEPLHGHDFAVTVRVLAAKLDALETVTDFHEIDEALQAICGPLRNQNLNTLEPFVAKWNPSAERIAEHIGRQLMPVVAAGLADAEARRLWLGEVRVTEAHNCLAIWMPD